MHRLGYMTVSEILETMMQENDVRYIFPEFSKAVHIFAVIPATSCSAEQSFTALCRLKTYLCSTVGQQRVGNIALYINIERAYANSVVSNDMDRIIDICGRRNGRGSYFFRVLKCFLSSYDRFICKNIFTSYVGHC